MYATVSSKIYESDRAHCVIKIEFLNLTELAKWANDFAHWQSAQQQQKMTFIETVKLPEGTLKLGFVYILKLMNKQYKQSIFEQFKRHTHTIRYLIWFQYGFNWLFHDEIEHIYDPLLFVTLATPQHGIIRKNSSSTRPCTTIWNCQTRMMAILCCRTWIRTNRLTQIRHHICCIRRRQQRPPHRPPLRWQRWRPQRPPIWLWQRSNRPVCPLHIIQIMVFVELNRLYRCHQAKQSMWLTRMLWHRIKVMRRQRHPYWHRAPLVCISEGDRCSCGNSWSHCWMSQQPGNKRNA